MADDDSTPLSIERCRELLGAESSGLSDQEIEAVRDQTLVCEIIDIYLDQQRQERARATGERGSIPVWSENGSRWKQTS